ncbi:MAG: dihydroorotate dehydrogenase [Spirochaetota bacterium]|nr:dihydroorotate dehydrogenase [Spirochaetota bacterium]
MDLKTNIGRIILKNPVITASGTFGYGTEYNEYIDLNLLGAISVKGLHVNPKQGNLPQRITETPCGMLNAIGLQGIGIDAFAKDKMPILRQYNVPILVNFWGTTIDEYENAVLKLNNIDGIAGLEVNISCPNIKEGGITFGTNGKLTSLLIKTIRKKTKLPLMVKLSPNVTSISKIAKIVESEGADSISLINTFTAMVIDIEKRKPVLSNVTGGLSGPAIRPIAVRMVWEVAKAVKIPVIGIGGIMNAQDALEFIIAGASAVQIGTANFVDPLTALKVIDGIEEYCVRHKISNFKNLIGSLEIG